MIEFVAVLIFAVIYASVGAYVDRVWWTIEGGGDGGPGIVVRRRDRAISDGELPK